jgi:hypothetical protein
LVINWVQGEPLGGLSIFLKMYFHRPSVLY